MPLLALTINIAWEALMGSVLPNSRIEQFVFCAWGVVDLGLVYNTLQYRPPGWRRESWAAVYVAVQAAAAAGMTCLVVSLVRTSGGDRALATFVSGYACQFVLSWASVAALTNTGTTAGVSWGIWATRTTGSIAALGVQLVRCSVAPVGRVAYMGEPALVYIIASTLLLDVVVYPLLFASIRKHERVVGGCKVPGGIWAAAPAAAGGVKRS
ncbi:hypothetical protein EDC01DRAFT_676878 [Geopyxis carbonaria]|nr:hypothetical protein EDC01DRAFT_676878 [Geopyxis carbonaria]